MYIYVKSIDKKNKLWDNVKTSFWFLVKCVKKGRKPI